MLKAPPKAAAPPRGERHLGHRWRLVRAAVMADRGKMCQRCWEEAGRITRATEGHHVVPRQLAPGLAYEPANIRILCATCHRIEESEGAGR